MRYVIVGGGTAGVTAAQKLRALDPAASVVLVEAEAVPHYLRPGLIEVLAGKKGLGEITPYSRDWFQNRGIEYRLGEASVGLDLTRREVLLVSGKSLAFDRLLLATGAEPLRPAIPGRELCGVFTLRSASDVERIRTWAEGRTQAVVLGGGWLGLEAAYALRPFFKELVVLERGPWPLSRYVDREAGHLLTRLLMERGLTLQVKKGVLEIRGRREVHEVRLSTGETLPADLVLIAIGVCPRTALAQDAGLGVNKGILVNDFLETAFPGVYAAGDVAEWRGKLYGIIPAAREQALVAAQNMVKPGSARYAGTPPIRRLKVAGVELLVLGETQPSGIPYPEEHLRDHGRYAKLVLGENRRLLGAIVLGYPECMSAVEELFRLGTPVPKNFLAV